MIVLGGQLEDPYSVENMNLAFAAIHPTKAGRVVLEATHHYVRFLPLDGAQYETLERAGLQLVDHPLDYEIVREGDYYHDPEVPEGQITWQYTVVPKDFVFPQGIRHEVLDDCYIPSSNFLAANGYVEIMNNSLTKADYYTGLQTFPAERCATIVNPLSQDLNVMRQTLILGGLEVIAYNLNRQISSLRTFEYGSVYSRLPEQSGETLEGYEEHPCFTLMLTGTPEKSWRQEPLKSNYFQLKGCVELLLRRYGADIQQLWAAPAPADIFSEGMVYSLPGKDRKLVTLGTVNPALARKFGIKQPVFAAEIEWPAFFELVKRDKVSFSELPKFPAVRRDLALLLDEQVSYADLRAAAFKQAKKLLRQVGLFDVYRGDKIPAGKKQYALSFVIQDLERTLTDQDTERVMERLLSTFQKDFGAQLR